MLGLHDFWISLAYLACILSALACVAYGLYNWNKGGDDEQNEIAEERTWEKKETEIDDNM
jgi:hypothetical protein